MELEREIICINCPMGCRVTVRMDEDGEIEDIHGNICPRGKQYASDEVKDPRRTVTAIVKTDGTPLSVRTDRAIPKGKILECLKEIDNVRIGADIKIGDILINNVADTGANVIATKNYKKI